MKLDDRDFDGLEYEDIETVRKRAERKKRDKRRKKKKGGFSLPPAMIPVIVVLILILIIFSLNYGGQGIEMIAGINVNADIAELFGGLNDNEAGIILNEGYETAAKAYIEDGRVFIPYDYVKDKLNDWYYHDENEGLILYTTPDGTDRLDTGDDARDIGNIFCISSDLLSKYTDIDYNEYLDGDVPYIHIKNSWGEYSYAEASKRTAVYVGNDAKSDVMAVLEEHDRVRVTDAGNDLTEVQTGEGLLGYVKSKDLDEYREDKDSAPGRVREMVFPTTGFNQKVILGWHQVMNKSANSTVHDIIREDSVINVLSPTWYSLSDENGSMTDNSSMEYVDAAHGAGKQVWSVIDNFNFEGFDVDKDTHEVLSYTSKRTSLIDSLVRSVKESGADGINVDFEELSADTGQHFAQFIKELSLACHDNGLLLSVDNYVPEAYSLHYHREVQGKVCDFCVIMGYDEYNASSTEAGPVASLDFVERGIERTLTDVDASRVINGVPFFTRLWETQNGSVKSTQALGMGEAAGVFTAHGVTASWDDATACNYGEYESGGSLWRMWLEDSASLKAKLSVMESYDLAGAAFWKLGLEDSSVWSDIEAYAAQ